MRRQTTQDEEFASTPCRTPCQEQNATDVLQMRRNNLDKLTSVLSARRKDLLEVVGELLTLARENVSKVNKKEHFKILGFGCLYLASLRASDQELAISLGNLW